MRSAFIPSAMRCSSSALLVCESFWGEFGKPALGDEGSERTLPLLLPLRTWLGLGLGVGLGLGSGFGFGFGFGLGLGLGLGPDLL